MSRLLGIDYGDRKVGLALSEFGFSEPIGVLRYKDRSELFVRLLKEIRKHSVEAVVVGVSEGESGKKQKEFGNEVSKQFGIPVYFEDETLTTYDAQAISLVLKKKRKKRRDWEDSYAASLILQRFLDRQS